MKIDIKKFNLAMANAQLSANELSRLSGISAPVISKIRKNANHEALPKTIGLLAEALSVKVEDLITDED